MATFTATLSLRKPDGTDFVSRVLDINNNLDSIDALFHATTGHAHTGAGTHGPKIVIEQNDEVVYDPTEAATNDTLGGGSKLINNLNRIRFWIQQVSGQTLGTVTENLNTHRTNTGTFHGTTGFGSPTAIGTANADGAGTAIPRNNHVHAHGSLGTIANAHAVADITNAAPLNAVAIHTKQYLSQGFDAGDSGTSKTIDWDNGNVQYVRMTGNCTFTFNNLRSGGRYVLRLLQDGTGGRTATWPASVKWPGGTAPTLSAANKKDMVGFDYDGTDALGFSGLNY